MRDGEVEGGEGEHSVVYDILHASHRDVVLVYLLAIHQAGRHLAGVLLLVLFFGDRERWVGSAQLLLVLPRLGETGGYAATKEGRRLLPKKTRIINQLVSLHVTLCRFKKAAFLRLRQRRRNAVASYLAARAEGLPGERSEESSARGILYS